MLLDEMPAPSGACDSTTRDPRPSPRRANLVQRAAVSEQVRATVHRLLLAVHDERVHRVVIPTPEPVAVARPSAGKARILGVGREPPGSRRVAVANGVVNLQAHHRDGHPTGGGTPPT